MHRLKALLLFLFLGSGLLADEKTTDFVTIPKGQVITGDYFAAAENIEMSGNVQGDAYIAGMQVFIDGEIQGDLLLAAVSASIYGKVHGNIRFIGGQAMLTGEVGKNATTVAGNLQLLPASSIKGNLVTVAGTADLSAPIDGEATVVASNLRVSSSIGKTLQAIVGRLRLTSKAVIGGDLEYRGDETVAIDPGAIIRGKFVQYPTLLKGLLHGSVFEGLVKGSKFIALFMNFLFTFVVGVFFMRIFPKNFKNAHEALSHQPLKALGLGIVLLIALPLASLLLLLTILGAPFAIALLAVNVLTFYTAKILSVSWGANYLAKKTHVRLGPVSVFAIGLVIYYGLTMIPIAGYIIALAALLFGLGAGMLGRTHRNVMEKLLTPNA